MKDILLYILIFATAVSSMFVFLSRKDKKQESQPPIKQNKNLIHESSKQRLIRLNSTDAQNPDGTNRQLLINNLRLNEEVYMQTNRIGAVPQVVVLNNQSKILGYLPKSCTEEIMLAIETGFVKHTYVEKIITDKDKLELQIRIEMKK